MGIKRATKDEDSKDWPLWAHDQADGECKYLRLDTGEVLLIDPRSCAAHRDVAELRGVRDQVVSAGRVSIAREFREVYMAERDSWSLGIKSRPGDEDAQAIRAALFEPAAKKKPTRRKRKAS